MQCNSYCDNNNNNNSNNKNNVLHTLFAVYNRRPGLGAICRGRGGISWSLVLDRNIIFRAYPPSANSFLVLPSLRLKQHITPWSVGQLIVLASSID